MARTTQYCTFYLDGLFFGVEVLKVQEVLRFQRMTSVPLASTVINGLINLRGQIVTAVDLRGRLALPDRPADQLPMNVVIRTDDGAVSLQVDEIGDVVELSDEARVEVPETLTGAARALVVCVYQLKEHLLLVLDVEKAMDIGSRADCVSPARESALA